MTKFATDQENFWAGKFGDDYIQRNQGAELLASNLAFFRSALRSAGKLESCIELGANIGMNLRALKLLYPSQRQCAVEINPEAARELATFLKKEDVHEGSLLDFTPQETFELALIKGVLIHINPDQLPKAYAALYNSSRRYILICEYYNPSPVVVPYRGHSDRLFKRDFCGEMLETYRDLELVDYGFVYRRDPGFPQDDITWFLLRKAA